MLFRLNTDYKTNTSRGVGVWGGGAVVKSLNNMYKGSQQLNFTNFIYLHETKNDLFILKGQGYSIFVCFYSLYYVNFKKSVFHFEQNSIICLL